MHVMSKPMKASSETRSLSQQQVTDEKKPCGTCCDLDPLCPVEPSTENKIETYRGNRFITLCQTLRAYETSAELGCPICRALAAVFDHYWPCQTRDAKTILALEDNKPPEFWPVSVWPRLILYTKKGPGQENGLPHVPVLPNISSSSSSSEAFDFLHERLAECTREHTLCTSANTGEMPKRLIHFNDSHHAILVEATDGSKHAHATYAALSYCWGGDQKFKAKTSNLPLLMKNGFSIASLPIVWRESIGLCRKLGLSYLWIDAFCILQDDGADWAEESVRMGAIYENAYLTIAAASSDSVDTPYLDSTPDPSRKPVEFTVLPATSGRPATTVFARVRPRYWHFKSTDEVKKDPWRLRGWTLQEEILSRRLVVFGTEEMQWRCRTTTSCECQANCVYSDHPKGLYEGDGNSSSGPREVEMWTYWRYSVVGRFGARQSTHPEDIFSALSGITQRIARATGWTYVAGMWKENLIFEMCWHNTFVEGLEPFYRVYTAPTFSWCSVNGTRVIHMWLHEDKFTPDAELVDFNVELKYANAPFSTLVDGCVVLRGRLALASLEYADGKYCVVLNSSTQGEDGTTCSEKLKFDPDTHLKAVPVATSSPEGQQDKTTWTGTRASKAPSGHHTARLGAPPESGGCMVWMLLLGTCIQRICDGEDAQCVLVLGKSVRRPGAYERLGLVSNGNETGRQLNPMKNCGWTETLTIV